MVAIRIPRQAASSTPNLSIDILSLDGFQYVIGQGLAVHRTGRPRTRWPPTPHSVGVCCYTDRAAHSAVSGRLIPPLPAAYW